MIEEGYSTKKATAIAIAFFVLVSATIVVLGFFVFGLSTFVAIGMLSGLLLTISVFLFVSFRYRLEHLANKITIDLKHKTKALETLRGDLKEQIKVRGETEGKLLEQKTNLEEAKLTVTNLLRDLEDERTKLEETKVKDEALLDSIADGVIATDREEKVIFINEAGENLFSWVSGQVLGREWNKNLLFEIRNEDGTLANASNNPIRNTIDSGEKTTTIYKFVKKDKTSALISVNVSPVVMEGKIIGAIAMFRDITTEREVDKAKTEFVSLASHQLRTPLSSINWYTEMLLAGDAGKISEEQRTYLNEIYKGNQRMVELVNSLLNASRVELGSLAVEPELIDFSKISDSVISELKPTIIQKRLTVEAKYGDNVPIINADPKLIRIIFQNLLSNAVKYTPEDGTIKIGFDKQDEFLLIIIADTGYGIPRDQQGKIFKKLFRADNVREKDTDGTGLGLYLVKSIIDSAGGSIHFYSDENKGTIFYIQFPLAGMKKREGVKSLIEKKKVSV